MKKIRFRRVKTFEVEYGEVRITFANATVARKAALSVLSVVDVDLYRHNNHLSFNAGIDSVCMHNEFGYYVIFK